MTFVMVQQTIVWDLLSLSTSASLLLADFVTIMDAEAVKSVIFT